MTAFNGDTDCEHFCMYTSGSHLVAECKVAHMKDQFAEFVFVDDVGITYSAWTEELLKLLVWTVIQHVN